MYRYIDAPRFAQLRDQNLGGDAAKVAITSSGSYAVVADPATPAELVGHALDYADRLAELEGIPTQRQPTEPTTQAPTPQQPTRPLTGSRIIRLVTTTAVVMATLSGCTFLEDDEIPTVPSDYLLNGTWPFVEVDDDVPFLADVE